MKRVSDNHGRVQTALLILTVAIVTLSIVPSVAAQSNKLESGTIVPNTEIQSYLRNLISTNHQVMFEGTEQSFSERLTQLRKMAGQDKILAVQLMYFSAHNDGEREALLPGIILRQLAIPNAVFAAVCLPLLDSENEPTRRMGAEWLTRADHVPGGVDFSRYEAILREKKQNPPQGLIRYMYERNPQAAVLSMSRVYGGDKATEAELADKLTGNPKTGLQSLADCPEWWARLYVAETMRKQPQLRDATLLKKLERDENPIVKEKVAEIAAGK